ncbi:MAG: hypothetical protein KGH65_03630 [Candidatus Micrarchaeota archaeon]|nr:hypothetical protein [Candidatus Micrarchaeota archaeon]
MRFSSAYARFRGSHWFLFALVISIGLILGLHFWRHIDPDFGATNLALSIESSVSVALLIMYGVEQEMQRKQEAKRWEKMLRYMLDMMESNRAMLKQLHESHPHKN